MKLYKKAAFEERVLEEIGQLDVETESKDMQTEECRVYLGRMHSFAKGYHIEIPHTGWLKKQKFTSHSCGGWKSKIKESAGLVSSKASFLGLQTATFSLCPHVVFPLCTASLGSPCVFKLLLIKTQVILD